MQRTELFFGTSEPDGRSITDAEFQNFLANVVTPRFPQGLTVLHGDGQWRDDRTGQITREHCRLLILIHPDDGSSDESIEQIRANYKSQFHQQSVLRTDDVEHVSF